MNRLMLGLILTSLVAVGCRKEPQPEPKPTTAAQTAAQPEKPAVKLTLSFQPGEAPGEETKAAAQKLVDLVAERSGFAIEPMFPESYADAIDALRKGDAQVVLLSGWAFLHAHHNADASLLMAEERDGKASFESQWFVASDSKIEKTADLRNKRIAFTSPTSAPGFLFPYARLIEDKVVERGEDLQKAFKEVYFTGGEADALGVLLQGKVDAAAGAAFAPALYLKPEEQAKIKAIAPMQGVPTHVLAVRADLDPKVQEKLTDVLVGLNAEDGLLLGAFGMQKLVKRSYGDHMMPLQNAQELVGAHYMVPSEPDPEVTPPTPEDEQ